MRHEVEVAMTASQTEWEAQESQWLVEHEEEVRALRQRNCQLLQLLEDTRSQYQDFITEQEREVGGVKQNSYITLWSYYCLLGGIPLSQYNTNHSCTIPPFLHAEFPSTTGPDE